MNTEKPLSTADLARAAEAPRPEQRVKRDPPLDQVDIRGAQEAPAPAGNSHTRLFGDRDAADLRKKWSDIQTGFVDEPRKAVENADALVADVMKRLAEGFTAERSGLEKQWDRGDTVTTEDLRVALQRYRSFFDRLLAA
jgi:hypothetical protein